MADNKLQEQFALVLDEHKKIVFKVCNLYCSRPDEREDLFQDIVYQLWKAFPSFKANAKVTTWMYRVAINTAMNFLRQKERIQRKKVPLFEGAARYYPHQEVEDDRIKQLENCIRMLPALEKTIMILYLDGYPHEDIGNIVGISKSNVGTRIGRIKEKLKSMMTKGIKGGKENG